MCLGLYLTCSASRCPTVAAGLSCVFLLGFSHLPGRLSKPPTASPSPATRRSGTPAPPPAPLACCMWSSESQCSGRRKKKKLRLREHLNRTFLWKNVTWASSATTQSWYWKFKEFIISTAKNMKINKVKQTLYCVPRVALKKKSQFYRGVVGIP